MKSDLEEDAKAQLANAARLEGVCEAIGLPDLHPGKGYPIGAAVLSEKVVYPHLVGEDIGCGMSLVRTGIMASKQKAKKWHKKLLGLEGRAGPALEQFTKAPLQWPTGVGVAPVEELADVYLQRFGTVGRGNHFAEIQEVVEVQDPDTFSALNLDLNQLYLLVHSGSRNYGESVYEEYTRERGIQSVGMGTAEMARYMRGHDQACAYAKRSRAVIAYRLLSQLTSLDESWLSSGSACVLDVWHNFVEQLPDGRYVHRKGATPATLGVTVGPG